MSLSFLVYKTGPETCYVGKMSGHSKSVECLLGLFKPCFENLDLGKDSEVLRLWDPASEGWRKSCRVRLAWHGEISRSMF